MEKKVKDSKKLAIKTRNESHGDPKKLRLAIQQYKQCAMYAQELEKLYG